MSSVSHRHKLLLLCHTAIVERAEQSGEPCVIKRSKTVSYRYHEEEGSCKYKVSWKVEKICREGQRNNLLYFQVVPCFLRTTEIYSSCSQFFAVRYSNYITNPLTLFVLHFKSIVKPIFPFKSSPLHFHFRAYSDLEINSQKRSWTMLENALLPINVPVNLLFCSKSLILIDI